MCTRERVTIDKEAIKKLVGSVDYDDLKALREESTRMLRNVRLRDRIKFVIYLQKEYVENFERALDWAFRKGLIKKRTRWAFTRFAVVNMIGQIIEEIGKERVKAEEGELAQRMASSSPFFPAEARQG